MYFSTIAMELEHRTRSYFCIEPVTSRALFLLLVGEQNLLVETLEINQESRLVWPSNIVRSLSFGVSASKTLEAPCKSRTCFLFCREI